MHNKVYSRYIYQMLMEYGCVAIPEVGTFYLRNNTAKYSENRQTLYPPQTELYFSPGYDKDGDFKSLLIESGLSEDDSSIIVHLFSEDYKDTKINNSLFKLDGLGVFADGIFTPVDREVFNKYHGLKEVQVLPISKKNIVLDENFEYYLNQKITKENKNSNLYFWPLLLSLLALICIILWFFNEAEPKSDADINKLNSSQNQVTTTSADSIYQQIESTLKDSLNIGNDQPNAEIEKSSESNLSNDTKSVKVLPALTSEKECIVIVGAFQDVGNAAKLVKRIKAKGYKPYQQDHNGLTRVGIKYDCGVNDQEAFKAKMKKIFNPEAWHLHDTI